MDPQSLDDWLTKARAANDAQLRPCRLVTDAFIPLPAHRVGVAHLFLRPRFVLADPTGTGKAQPLSTPIPTPFGWRTMGDLKVGDYVFGASGQPTRVIGIFPQGVVDAYRVTFHDRTSTVCSEDHLWSVRRRREQGFRVLPLKDIRNPRRRKDAKASTSFAVPACQPVEFAAPLEALPVDAYVLGALLGDGYFGGAVELVSADAHIVERFVEALGPSVLKPRLARAGQRTAALSYRFTGAVGSSVSRALKNLGCRTCRSWNKFIPVRYLRAPLADRIKLLQGLLDTDGWIAELSGCLEFSSVSVQLAADVAELVRSLGGFARVRPKTSSAVYRYKGEQRTGRPAYTVVIRTPFCPFSLPRKAARWHKLTHRSGFDRKITSVAPVGAEPMQCIKVDAPDGLYLTEQYIVTHNTPQAIVAYGYIREKEPSMKMLVVVGKSAQGQWRDSIHTFLTGVKAAVVGYSDEMDVLSPEARKASFSDSLQAQDVWITTYAMLTKESDRFLQYLSNFVLVFDEVHTLKNFRTNAKKLKPGDVPKLSQYGAALRLSGKARCCWGLSATPSTNDRLDELYSIFELVRPGTFGSYSAFRRTYYRLQLVKPKWKVKGRPGVSPRPFYEVLGYMNLDHLEQVVSPYYLKRQAEQIKPGLPAITYRVVDVFLPPKHRALYDQIRQREFPGATEPLQQLAAMTKAQQCVDAPEILGQAGVGNAKADELIELLTGELKGQKVLVYAKFTEVIDILSPKLTAAGILHSKLTGAETMKQRDATRVRFQSDPLLSVVLLTDAGGESLDLQAASALVLYDLPWSHGRLQQVVGRARRIGSVHANVLVILLGATHTIDTYVIKTLVRKESTIRTFLQQGNTPLPDTLDSQLPEDSYSIHSLFQKTKGGPCVPLS